MATVFVEADVSALERGAALAGYLDREPGDSRVLAELRQLEDRFGLSPLARRRLQMGDRHSARIPGAGVQAAA